MFWKKKPKENPQDAAIRDLEARSVKFDASELKNTLYSAGGGYLDKVNGQDVRNARALFGHLKGKGPVQVVGYLTPVGNGVEIRVNGLIVDRLKPEAAKKTLAKINAPTPVKIEVSIIPDRDPKWDRPHLVIMRGSTPPKN